MTNDLISREVLAKMEVKEKKAFDLGYMIGYEQGRRDEIDAVPVVHGEWIPVDIGDGNPGVNLECSHCGRWVKQKEMFCPKCGAKMDGGKNAAD